MAGLTPSLQAHESAGGLIEPLDPQGWRLSIPPGPDRVYRLAQLDDYMGLPREKFLYTAPLRVSLKARASEPDLLGTWGFGLWNDPFSMGFNLGGAARRIPALPNTAWFFFASPPNYLSVQDDLPARGLLAATFSSHKFPTFFLTLGALGIPLLAWRPVARKVREFSRRWIKQSAVNVTQDVTRWHTYEIDWQFERTLFRVDGECILSTQLSPLGPLGLVMWIDNQYAAFTPKGSLAFGTLPNPRSGWLEITDLVVE